jgi:hypothetical protein
MSVQIVNNVATFTGTGTLSGATGQLGNATSAVVIGYNIIGDNSFWGASSITQINIPHTVTYIGQNAFYQMTSLTTIIFDLGPNDSLPQLESIENWAFQGTTALQSITFPASLKFIGLNVFYNASALTTINFAPNSKLLRIDDWAFNGATSLIQLSIPSTVTAIGPHTFQNSGITTLIIPSINGLGLTSPSSSNVTNYGKTFNVTTPEQLISTYVINNSIFTSLLTSMSINTSNITSEIIASNDPYIAYTAKLTIPNGIFSNLTYADKTNLIATIKSLYSQQLGVTENQLVVTLSSGSIVGTVRVLNPGITSDIFNSIAPICFPSGTLVTTNQGNIAIEQLNPDIHTIRGKRIVAITQTRPLRQYMVSIEKHSLLNNVPSHRTTISKEHKILYKGQMMKAKDLIDLCDGVTKIPYNGEILYNVLMEKHDKMLVNNLICETLDPTNIMAKICGGKYNDAEQNKICLELNNIIKSNNISAYKKLYDSLK